MQRGERRPTTFDADYTTRGRRHTMFSNDYDADVDVPPLNGDDASDSPISPSDSDVAPRLHRLAAS
jgi:hypothetical protein